MTPRIALSLLAVIAGMLTSCTSGPPTPNPDQEKMLKAVFVNPYPPGTYEHFRADPSYPKTYRVYRNHAALSNGGSPRIAIDLGLQRALLYKGDDIAMDYPVSTGRSTFPTPPGNYKVVEKVKADKESNTYGTIYNASGGVHKSNADLNKDEVPEGGSYKGAPMPYWMRLTWSGIGMHKGKVPRYPASHGCIRMPSSVASSIFSHADLGTPVSILP
jgi:lipoprotein-anchoring transpeptidase ErfK/SrfK